MKNAFAEIRQSLSELRLHVDSHTHNLIELQRTVGDQQRELERMIKIVTHLKLQVERLERDEGAAKE